nr:uncharacterized protein LOC115260739 [Aedes albopictus]
MKIILLFISIVTATVYQDISNHNGLITINLHKVRIRTGYHRIIHKVDLNDVQSNLLYIENVSNLLNLTDHLADTFLYKLNIAKNKLNSLYPKRHKRGLVNALGTVIKFVAGNPDNEDLELVQHNLEKIESTENRIISNQDRQIKINNSLQKTVNKVSITIAKIAKRMSTDRETFRKDVEEINLILNLDIIIKILEDIEEQIIFSKSNILNKNILPRLDKDYIIEFYKKQGIKLYFDDEILESVKCITTLKDEHIIFIIKLPVVESQEYQLIQLEATNINGSRINLETQYVAKFRKSMYKQSERCVLCDNTHKLADECVYNILTNQAAKCNMSKDTNQFILKEIIPGTILLDTRVRVHVYDSCGDDRIIAATTIIESENCTVKIHNQTFLQNSQTLSNAEFSTPIFGKRIEANKQIADVEEVHQAHLENLEEIARIRLQLSNSQMIGGATIASITIFLLIIVYLHRFRKQCFDKPTNTKAKIIADKVTSLETISSEGNPTPSKFIPLPRLTRLEVQEKSNEDARHLRGETLGGSRPQNPNTNTDRNTRVATST